MTTTTARAVHLKCFNEAGRHGGSFTGRTRQDWTRDYREARERAGRFGTVLLYSATVDTLTGKLLSTSATPAIVR